MIQNIVNHLDSIGQKQLSVDVDRLTLAEREYFLNQLERYPLSLVNEQRKVLAQKENLSALLDPLERYQIAGLAMDKQMGEQYIAEGKVGCIILAGGQGTRIGAATGSKGMVPISLIKNKSLFQLFFEKTLAASKKYDRALPLAVMTSPVNFASTLEYLECSNWFGVTPNQVDLFVQEMLPFMDDTGNWILQSPGKIAEGPDGNGNFFKAFCRAGICKKWKESGVQYIHVIVVDNPLADPFDAELYGYHSRTGAEATIKAIMKIDPLEQVGTIVSKRGRPRVVEYSEFPKEELVARNDDGSLRFPLANISLLCFDIDFIDRMGQKKDVSLPWHLARKLTDGKMIWKFETFLFDLLEYTEKSEVLVYPRETCFAPLKNRSGESSFETVKSALLASDKAAYLKVTGIPAPDKSFELDQSFYYPTNQFLEKWKGKALPDGEYIDADCIS